MQVNWWMWTAVLSKSLEKRSLTDGPAWNKKSEYRILCTQLLPKSCCPNLNNVGWRCFSVTSRFINIQKMPYQMPFWLTNGKVNMDKIQFHSKVLRIISKWKSWWWYRRYRSVLCAIRNLGLLEIWMAYSGYPKRKLYVHVLNCQHSGSGYLQSSQFTRKQNDAGPLQTHRLLWIPSNALTPPFLPQQMDPH